MSLTIRRNRERDLEPLSRLLTDEGELTLVNPNAGFPFDPLEWNEKWLGDLHDESFYILDAAGNEVGFFALRVGAGPEIRHLTYVFVAEEARGGAGAVMADFVEAAARDLGALTITLKCELDNAPALNAYLSAGYEELSRRDGMATMRLDLDGGLA
jgi:RimJ/RimL family protein N-acetyltransferase